MIGEVWFWLLFAMLAAYAVLDGFDFGVGILHFKLGHTDKERNALLRSVGPVWDGNEVFLIAGGATLFLAFPKLFASAFAGFYLPLMLVLFLLIFRALGIEMRHQLSYPVWNQLWDAAFFVASSLLAFIFGAALGNVVRGVSFDASGRFFAPLWTDFDVVGAIGILDWYTVLCGLSATVVLARHGNLWIASRCADPMRERAMKLTGRLSWSTLAILGGLTAATAFVQPRLVDNLLTYPIGWIAPIGTVVSFGLSHHFGRKDRPLPAFLASAGLIASLLASAAFATYPYVLVGRGEHAGLTIESAQGPTHGLTTALWWWLPGMALVLGYFVFMYKNLPKDIRADDDGH